MAESTHMPRRGFLKAIPAVSAAALAPAALSAGEPESEIAVLFREWQAMNDYINRTELSDEEVDMEADQLREIEEFMISRPARTARDLAMKLYAHSNGDVAQSEGVGGEMLNAEIRELAS